MRYLVTAQEMKEYDRITIEEIGIPGLVLMERAALKSLEVIEQEFGAEELFGKKVIVLAGYGNNGGDGLALARLLAERGCQVKIWCVGSEAKATDSFRVQKKICDNFDIPFVTIPGVEAYDIAVDALFGVGLTRLMGGEYANAVELFNRLSGWKLSLDIPSGIDADTGKIMGAAVKADATVTFGFEKRGLYFFPGNVYAGKISCVDIGITERAFQGNLPQMFVLDDPMSQLLPSRDPAGNKGTFGKVLLIAGSVNMAGAAILAGNAAYRIGAGMVKVISPEENRVILQTSLPEALLGTEADLEDSLNWADVVAIGPGIGRSEKALSMLRTVICQGEQPLVLDADALNLLSDHEELLQKVGEEGRNGRTIIVTPHPGELARLMKLSVPEVKDHLLETGTQLATGHNLIVVAKDARTIICSPDMIPCMNISGNSGMGTAGSGDVLTGMIAGMLAQGTDGFEAACRSVRIHGLCGDAVAENKGEHGCMAGDLWKVLS